MAKTNQQIIVTEGDFGVEILTQFIDTNKKPIPIEGCSCKIKFAYDGNIISEKTGVVIDEPKGIVSVVLDKEETQYSGLWTSYWICYDQFNNVTTTENIYYYVQPAIGSVNNPAFTELLNYYNRNEVNDIFKNILEQLNNYILSKDYVKEYIEISIQDKIDDDFVRQCVLDALGDISDYVKKEEVETINSQLTNVIKTVKTKLTNDVETINSQQAKLTNDIKTINSQMDTKASLSYVDTKIGNMGNTKTFKGSCMFSALPAKANVDDYWYVSDKSTNYCWNGTSWVDIGYNLNIGDGTLTSSKFAFAPVIGVKSKNLFNKNNVTSGYYVDYKSGKLVQATGYSASEFIMVESNTEYCKNTTHQLAFYDVNKTYISGLNTDKVFTTPTNCVYIRLSVKNDVLNTLQLEKGNIQTDYVDYDLNTIDMRTINDGGITKEKLSFIPCELTRSKNLFNKEEITKGYYINYTTGKPAPNVDYCISNYIEVLPNTTYSKVTTYQFAFYDETKTFISGINTDTTFITPNNCKYIRLSVKLKDLNNEQLEQGDTQTTYENYGLYVPRTLLPQELFDKVNYNNFLIVSKDNPQLDTINKALDKLKNIDTKDNPCTILLMPGIYEESVILAYRYITIIGVDKDTCIITNKLNDYYKPPIDLTPNSHLKNLTIIADNDGIVEIPDVGAAGHQSYAVHFDSAGRYYNSKTEGLSRIENCILISNNFQALGSGLCINQKLICENVEFIAYKNNNAMRIHNYSLEGGYGSSAVFKDCTFISENAEPIHVQNVNNKNIDTEITFIRNVAYNNNGQADCLRHEEVLSDGSISGNIILGKGSFGNSIAELNK